MSDKKFGVDSDQDGYIDYYETDVITATDYSTYGASLPRREYNFDKAMNGFNGQQRDKNIQKDHHTAKYWEYDPRIARRWNIDPKPSFSISPYNCFNGNPIWFVDKLGDSSVIDNKGYIVHYDKNDKDLRVFMQQDGKLTLVGNLGGDIEAKVWFKNLLESNSKDADKIWDPMFFDGSFKDHVRQDGVWDYKYRSPANQDQNTKKLPHHIIGIAFQRKDKDKDRGVGDLPETSFIFDGNKGRAEDLNNYHFGVVGKASGLFSEGTMLKTAGGIEMAKWKEDYKNGKRPTPEVPTSWRPVKDVIISNRGVTRIVLGWPYGDNPEDSRWIQKGFKYYDAHSKDLDGE